MKTNKNDVLEKIKEIIQIKGGLIKTAELYELGLDYRGIQDFVREGHIQRVKNGYYGIHFEEKSEESILAGLFFDGVLCLESALYYYQYIDNKPLRWHIAVDKNTSKSRFKLDYPLIQPYYVEPEFLMLGAEKITFGEGSMFIYDKERMICDCLKFEEKLGREVMKKAVMAYINEEEKDIGKLLEYAKVRKVVQKVQNRIGVWL